jgi:cysteine desulfuration protein SufE
VDAFKKLGDQKLRVQQLLHMAAALPPFPRERRVLGNRVRGCLSVVHVDAVANEEGKIDFIGESDSQLTKGLVAFLIRGLSGYTAEEICAVSPEFIKESGLSVSLTPGRTNGFLNMLRTMQDKAKLLMIGASEVNEASTSGGISMREHIEKKLQMLKPDAVVIRDDSAKHRGHEGAHVRRGETHFTIKIVSDVFKDLPEVKRHQLVYSLLKDELSSRRIHAISLVTLTAAEAHSEQSSV